MTETKKVVGSLVGVDGSAFSIMGHFKKLARRQGFSQQYIDSVISEAASGDYDHLVSTISDNMEIQNDATN
jgi:hypothetical protein